jgi:hypothetical protein
MFDKMPQLPLNAHDQPVLMNDRFNIAMENAL